MEIATADIKTFQELYQTNFGIELDEDAAKDTAQHLLQIMRLVYKPITKNEFINLHGNNNEEARQPKSKK